MSGVGGKDVAGVVNPWGALVEIGIDCREWLVWTGCESDGLSPEGVDDDGDGVVNG